MRDGTLQTYKERMLRVLEYIHEHLDDPMDLETLARRAHFSAFHFHRVFRGMIGEPVKDYVRRLRIERAAVKLKLTDWPVTRIALESGYETHETFTRAFKAQFGVAPSVFRRQRRAMLEAGAPISLPPPPQSMIRKAKKMNVRVGTIEPMRVVYTRHVGPYQNVKIAWDRICMWAGQRGLFGPRARFVGISYDDPEITPPEKIRYDACISIDGDIRAEGDIGVQTIGGGTYAITLHKGPYNRLNETYALVCGQWAPAARRELRSAPCLEFYLNDPDSTPEAELLTEVCVPIEED